MDKESVKNELRIVSNMIWQPLLKEQLEFLEEIPEDIAQKENTRIGCVHILGGWFGSISVQCSEKLAQEITQKMLEQNRVSDEDIDSALQELSNVSGGNIKSLLGEGCILSTPSAWRKEGFSFFVPDSEIALNVPFKVGDSYFQVTLHQGNFDINQLNEIQGIG